jgi:hypothetical protein
MRNFFLLALVAITMVCLPTFGKGPFVIQVSLDAPFTGKVYLSHVTDHLVLLDSLVLNNVSEFTFQGSIDADADNYRIMSRPFKFDTYVIVEPNGRYRIRLNGRDATVDVEQGDEQKLLNQFYVESREVNLKIDSLEKRYPEASKNPDSLDYLQKQLSQYNTAAKLDTRILLK